MPMIAEQLGHADLRMTARHYAYIAPFYVADTIRAHLPKFGIEAGNGGRVVEVGAEDRARLAAIVADRNSLQKHI